MNRKQEFILFNEELAERGYGDCLSLFLDRQVARDWSRQERDEARVIFPSGGRRISIGRKACDVLIDINARRE